MATTGRISRSGTIVYACVADVRAAVSATSFPPLPDLFHDVEAQASASASSLVDMDIDADLPLPADCLTEWTRLHQLTDRLRAMQISRHACLVLARVLRSQGGDDKIDDVLQHGENEQFLHHSAQSNAGSGGATAAGQTAASPVALALVVDDDRTMELLERLPEPEDHLAYNVTLKTRLSTARREAGRALAAFLGTPRILAAAVDGDLPFNKLDKLLYRVISAQLTLVQMNEVDEFAHQLRTITSLDQFDKRVRAYIRTYLSRPAPTPESIYERRGVDFQKFPDGSAEYRAFGPAVDLEGFYQRGSGTSRAIHRSEMEALVITDEVGEALGFGSDGKILAGGDLQSVDERRISQLMFDTLVSSVPQTRVRVMRKSDAQANDGKPGTTDGYDCACSSKDSRSFGGSGASDTTSSTTSTTSTTSSSTASSSSSSSSSSSTASSSNGSADSDESSGHAPDCGSASHHESFVVTVACPTTGSWLRKQAAVTVTMSLATLAGLSEESATLGLSTPLPAAQARQVASKSTVWRRLIHDPATGTITDEATRTYTPTTSMRRAVEQKWRTCMAPGCSRNAAQCEIDHCEPFCHDDPGRGGPTHLSNLVPLCVLHHQLKTNGVIRLKRVGPDEVEWTLPLGVVTRTRAPSVDIDRRQQSVSENVLGLRLRSPAFEGSLVSEVLHGCRLRTDYISSDRVGCRSRTSASLIEIDWEVSGGGWGSEARTDAGGHHLDAPGRPDESGRPDEPGRQHPDDDRPPF